MSSSHSPSLLSPLLPTNFLLTLVPLSDKFWRTMRQSFPQAAPFPYARWAVAVPGEQGWSCTNPLQPQVHELPLWQKPKASFIKGPSLRLQNDYHCQNYAKCWDSAFLHFFWLVGMSWESGFPQKQCGLMNKNSSWGLTQNKSEGWLPPGGCGDGIALNHCFHMIYLHFVSSQDMA